MGNFIGNVNFESIFGLGGLIAAPIFYAYLKLELKDARMI